ncbi:MAG: cytochrome c [Verrucomicrobiota bacterium]|nr:cytochrome c [Verrucomicrobiota bacterium]
MSPWIALFFATIAQEAEPPPSAIDMEEGKALYRKNCTACHGTDGRGDTPMGRAIPNMPDFTSAVVKQMTDQELFDMITKGSPPMPSFQHLSEAQRWDLVKYIRTFSQ